MFRALALAILCAIVVACRASPEVRKTELVRQADAYVEAQQLSDAITTLRSAVQIDPRDGSVRYKLAKVYAQAGRWAEFNGEAIRAAELLPDDKDVQLLALDGRLGNSEFVDAVALASELRARHPDDPEVLLKFALAHGRVQAAVVLIATFDDALRVGRGLETERQGLRPTANHSDDLAAEAAFRRVLQLDPDAPDARIGLAGLLWVMGRTSEGIAELRRAADRHPDRTLASRALGLYYLAAGLEVDAEKYLRVASEHHDGDARHVLVEFLAKNGRRDQALTVLTRAAQETDAPLEVIVRLAELELEGNSVDGAKRWNDRALQMAPRDPASLTMRAQLLGRTGGPAALAAAQAAVSAAPRSSEAHAALGQALAAIGETERAYQELTEAYRINPRSRLPLSALPGLALELGHDRAALEFARQRVERDPQDPSAVLALANAQIRVGEFGAAQRTLRPLLTQQRPSAAVLVARGAIEAGLGKSEAAQATYEQAFRIEPTSFEAFSALVLHNVARRRLPAANQLVATAMSTQSRNPAYLAVAGQVAMAANDSANAESRLRQALGIDPAHTKAAEILASVLIRTNRPDEALGVLDAAIALRPSLGARTARAETLEAMGRTDEAITQYEGIVTKYPDAVAVAVRLAVLYVDHQRNLDRALELASEAKQQLPDDPSTGDALGWVYVNRSLEQRGIAELERAVSLAPEHPTYRYHLGAAYLRLYRTQPAREQFGRALALSQDFPEAKQTRAALESLK